MKNSLSETSSSKSNCSSSSEGLAEEDYSWVTDKNFSIENKKDFVKYPLNKWRDLVYMLKSTYTIISERRFYIYKVKKVLKHDIFKDCDYYYMKDGIFGFSLIEYYKMNLLELINYSVLPDFFIFRMKMEKFKKLLEDRKYMMRTFKKLNENKKYVSIIIEIKVSHKRAFKNNGQRKDYFKFVEKAIIPDDEELILMYIYDESYKLFKEDKPQNEDNNIFLILCYIPKLYNDECYIAYNNIIDELKLNIKKINTKEPPKREKKLTKKELIKISEELKKELKNNELILVLIAIAILILIISILLIKKN